VAQPMQAAVRKERGPRFEGSFLTRESIIGRRPTCARCQEPGRAKCQIQGGDVFSHDFAVRALALRLHSHALPHRSRIFRRAAESHINFERARSLMVFMESGAAECLEHPARAATWQDYLVGQTGTHPLFRRRNLSVAAGQGNVVLTGTVISFYEKQIAQEFIRHCDGVRLIDNQIEVTYASDQP